MTNSKESSLQLPLLDISQPLLPSSLSSLSHACMEWGFFHITNHGIPQDIFEKIHTMSSQAFKLPKETKLKLGPSSPINTYTPHHIASPFFESLRVSGPDYYSSAKSSADVLFGPPHTEFCDVLQEYGSKMIELSNKIMGFLLKCLGDDVKTKYFESEFSSCHGYLRINNYTTPAETVEPEEELEGLGMHTDMSCVTILFHDEIGGLQVRSKDGIWMDVVPNKGTLVVNVGDLLQAWSNGLLRSAKHRVVLKKPGETRFSMAFFWCFEDEKVVVAPAGVVREGEDRIYKPFVCSDYVKYRESSEVGRFDKVGNTVDDFDENNMSNHNKESDDIVCRPVRFGIV